MQHQDAHQTLQKIDGLRASTRERLHSSWFPNILWGTLVLIGGPIADLTGAWVALYWAVIAPLGGIATGLYYHRREERLGLRDNPWPWLAVAVALVVGAFIAGAFLPGDPQGTGPMLVAAAGVTSFGMLSHHRATIILGIVSIGVCMAVALLDPPIPNVLMALVLGGGGVLIGLRERQQESRLRAAR